MNKLEEKLSYKNPGLQKSRFIDQRIQRHNSHGSEELITQIVDENVPLTSNYSSRQIFRNRTSKAVPENSMKESMKQTEKNVTPKKSRMKSDENFPPFGRDNRNMKIPGSKKQNNEKYFKKSSTGTNICENTDQLNRESNICETKNEFSRIDKNDLSLESEKVNRVFKSNKPNVTFDEQNYLNIPTGTEEYSMSEDVSEKYFFKRAVTDKDNFYGYQNCELLDLLYFNVDMMQDQQLFEYSFALKSKILEKMCIFKDSEKTELEFLCAITDGNQTQKNQKLITKRMYHVLHIVYEKVPVEPTLKDNYFVSPEWVQSPDEISNIGEECSLSYEYEEDEQYARSTSNTTFSTENSKRNICNTENSSSTICRQESVQLVPELLESSSTPNLDVHEPNSIYRQESVQLVPELLESGSTPNLDVKEPISSHDCSWSRFYVLNNLEKKPDRSSECETSYSIQEPFDNYSMQNRRETKSVSDDIPQYEDSIFRYFELENLLNYDVDAMHGSSLIEYAFVLKRKVLENISTFSHPVKETLEFLCELTDGTQLEVNQRLITMRMCDLVNTSSRKSQKKHHNNANSKKYYNNANSKKHYNNANSKK